jgi:hypothetical protein
MPCSPACHQVSGGKNNSPPIVGTWFVKTPEAPFQYQMFVFNLDGTMRQANPDAGDPTPATVMAWACGFRMAAGLKVSSSRSRLIERRASSSAGVRFPF